MDTTSDGLATAADLDHKFRFGPGPFALVDLSEVCVNGSGIVSIAGRQGLWIKRANTTSVSWEVTDSEAISFTKPTARSITINGGSSRVETYEGAGELSVANGLIYAG